MPPALFDREARLPGWSTDQLATARVIVAGMGALGNAVAPTLASCGVGSLLLVDPDVVEPTNLPRSPLFRSADVGRSKAEVAARVLRELAPGATIEARVGDVSRVVGLGELEGALLIGCLDSRAARVSLAARRGLVGGAWLDGATGVWAGEVRPYLDPEGPCYACALSPAERAHRDLPWACGAGGEPSAAAAPLSAAVAALLALLAVRYLLGQPVGSELRVLDGATGMVRPVSARRSDDCPYHRRLSTVQSVDVSSLDTLATLRAAMPFGAEPLVWEPIVRARTCRRCTFRDEPWMPTPERGCPQCGSPLQLFPTTSLEGAPSSRSLEMFGVPPQEILPVRWDGRLAAVRLKAAGRLR